MGKHLLFNLASTQPVCGSLWHGGGKYGEILLRKIIEHGKPVTVAYDSSRWLNPDMIELCEKNTVKMVDISKDGYQQAIDNNGIDILYSPEPLDDLYALKNCEIVVTIHDLRVVELPLDKIFWRYKINKKYFLKNVLRWLFPEYIKKRRYNKNRNFIFNTNVRYVVVSNHTLNSLKFHFPELIDAEIPVFYSPSTSRESVDGSFRNKDYFLLVSGDRWEKNNLRAIMALDRLFSRGLLNDRRVIVTGVKSADFYRYKIANPDKFEFVGYVSDQELNQLYHDAYCFMYPSLNEGFGYPPLEAMRYGVPVLSSPFSSISEVCGDAVLYFNPFSIDEIAMRIIALEDGETYRAFSAKGKERYGVIKKRQDKDLTRLTDFIYK